ncbi:MAG: DUF4091 domain-containing protein [Planctomycetes bacterium]|nr:DUF4091 domain-containing protein [Planctomycetota bacterium]
MQPLRADEPLRLDVTRDTWVSAFPGEQDANLGGAARLKLKGIQEMAVIDIDPAPLRGRVVTAATFHFHPLTNERPRRVSVSTLATDWVEGTSNGYRKEIGSASFKWAKQDQQPWAFRGSDLTAAMNGGGNTIWSFSDATDPDANGYQSLTVDPRVVAARVAGISHGFVLFDDVGSEWSRDGNHFTFTVFLNRFIASREAGRGQAPYLTVSLGEKDGDAPDAVTELHATSDRLPPGEATVTWLTPSDHGPAGVIGFEARYSDKPALNWATAAVVPRYLIPMAGKSGVPVTMHLRDLVGVAPGTTINVAVRAIDAAGNIGDMAVTRVALAPEPAFKLDDPPVQPFEELALPPTLGGVAGVEVSVIDALDKVNPVSGVFIPDRPESYTMANHIWSASKKLIRLRAARGEAVDFQVLLRGRSSGVSVSLQFDDPAPGQTALFVARHVNTPLGPFPDPLLPITKPVALPDPAQNLPLQRWASLFAEVQVSKDAAPGVHTGTLTLAAGAQRLVLAVELTVLPFALPDELSFIPQMNCYGLPDPPGSILSLAWYRMAHRNRVCLNRLCYNWRGEPNPAVIPDTRRNEWDWSDFDRSFAGMFDGSAFADLPRAGQPVEAFYLPLNENWPAAIDQGYRGGYWADLALTPGYRRKFSGGAEQFTRHFDQKKWTRTMFEFFMNTKVYFKRDGWDRTSALWVFDEPVNTQDFYALRWYGTAFHRGVADARQGFAGEPAKMLFRADISRPQWQRDLLDGVLDVNVVGGPFRDYNRMVNDRKRDQGHVLYNYASSNTVEQSNIQPTAWCIDTWTLGGDGVVPWQTIGNDQSWRESSDESIFYPGEAVGLTGPVASLRLKAYRRGQQDVEYLNMLCAATGLPRWEVAARVRAFLKLQAKLTGAGDDAAGTVQFESLDPVLLWKLRVAVGAMLAAGDKPIPPATDRWKMPPRDPEVWQEILPMRKALE